ncbi:gluconolactonase [Leptomonas pyrrhocoris]|uniref:Gluconolactonase n=1 Tax=Leptomonas pyrrhocoris TaxID=157538 RepID=A0A0N0DY76_LEPPY|nr:gluconolactonase [Leptomonas pyrrhocoris]XP_015662101.1 gluconolactonase [Leptomonas pyrrhocoris]XP_015662102.1 gluconolactonase [Leptomonas pyrrhocoris]KPA83661.1 gluconolactonase [Leptomonas pyrrhocoris]KPA83662.1 gluconolactonase [Leptomonas pyrrhocoris]KPA83663.1 gluconolactonase [Leptomonas pyrrhocoris]|eukprot:XP_015662100.1 gluconolactonase [Leptomonas pyrrhocoris]
MTLLPKNLRREAKDLVVEKMWTGAAWTEGPCWLPSDNKLLFSDVINSTQYLLDPETKTVSVLRIHTVNGNGNTIDNVNVHKHYYGFYPPELEDLADYIILTAESGRRTVSATVPPHAIERYIAKYGNDSSKSPAMQTRWREDAGLTRAHAIIPPYMMITNKVVSEKFQTCRYNSPNDIVIRPNDGTIWFTDPPFGITSNKEGYHAGSQLNTCHVFCIYPSHLCTVKSRTGKNGEPLPLPTKEECEEIGQNADAINRLNETRHVVRLGVTDVIMPNGLAFSPDGSKLYVADCSAEVYDFRDGVAQIFVYDIVDGGEKEYVSERVNKEGEIEEKVTLSYREVKAVNRRTFCEINPGIPDGFRVDADGYIYTSSAHAIIVYTPEGEGGEPD